ncbi:MAG: tetratricopeptide repeat protein [bacterium]
MKKKCDAGLAMISLMAGLCLLLVSVSSSYCGEIKETTPIEVEDRDFIHHLLQDKYYIFAQEEANEYLKRYPQGIFRAEIIFVQAEIDVIQKSYDAALSKYDDILNTYPNSELYENSLYLSGILHLQLGQSDKGQDKLQRLIQKYPQSPHLYKTYFQLGQLAFKQENWETAEVYLEGTVKNGDLNPDQQLEAKNYLAWTYYFQKKVDQANELFLPLLQSDLANIHKAKIAFQYAVDAQKTGNYRESIRWHEQLINQWPHPDFLNKSRFWVAESLFLLNQNPESRISPEEKQKAILLYSQNLETQDPVEPENSRYHRGWFLLDLEKKTQAEQDFEWLQKNNAHFASDVELTIIRANYFESRKKWDQANQIYAQSLKLQDRPENSNRLLIGIIRNDYRQKQCKSLVKNYAGIDFAAEMPVADEMHYYAGTCFYNSRQWDPAGEAFARIDLLSRFAPLVFESYLNVFRKTGHLADGIEYLNRTEPLSHFNDKERILLYKTDFHLELKQWDKALSAMKAVVAISPEKKKDPWFLLNVARTLDQISIAMKNKAWQAQRPDLRPVTYYRRQALIYYQASYQYMPRKEKAVRLSILDILIKRYEQRKQWKTLIPLYQTAIKTGGDETKKSHYTYRLANILIQTGAKKETVIPLLASLHGKANQDTNYKASALLAEVYIETKKYTEAIETLTDLAQQPIDDTPWYIKVHFRLGELYQSQEKWLTAIRHYSFVVNAKQDGKEKKEAHNRLLNIKKFIAQHPAKEKTE